MNRPESRGLAPRLSAVPGVMFGRMDEENAAETVCAGCGTVAEGTPVTWICSRERGQARYFCETCARTNIRAIEGRLDSPWW